jgi:hypothetical protein
MKLKILYDYAGYKAGEVIEAKEVIEVNADALDNLLDSGAVEVIPDPKPEPKPAKPAK